MKDLLPGLLRVVQAFAVVFGIMLWLGVPMLLQDGDYGTASICAAIGTVILYFLYPRPNAKKGK